MSDVRFPKDLPIRDPLIKRFYDYWVEKRGDRCCPPRAALDPLEFHYVLGDVVLIEVQRSGPDVGARWSFRYRLVGARITARDGYDLTGKSLDELPEPEYRERIRATWTEVCETGRPVHHVRDVVLDERTRRYEVIVLPLSATGKAIDMLVSVQREIAPARLAAATG